MQTLSKERKNLKSNFFSFLYPTNLVGQIGFNIFALKILKFYAENSINGICSIVTWTVLYKCQSSKKVDTQQLLWTRYYLKLKLHDNYQIRQEVEERTYWFPWRQHQFVTRTFAERKLGKGWNAGLGFTYFLQSLPHNPEILDFENRTELRPQFEIGYKQTISDKIILNHRYWTEFRFFEQPNSSFEYGNNRTRYKLEIRYSPFDKLTLKAFDEIHINIGGKIVQNVFDQNRYGASVQYMPYKNLGFELGYFNWYQQRKSGVDFYNRHIVRFTIHHTINFKNSKNQ